MSNEKSNNYSPQNLDTTNNSSDINKSNDNNTNSIIVNNPELESIKKKEKITNLENPEKIMPKIEIPKRDINNYEDSDELIDLSNEIEMITDELKETYYDDLLNKQDMSLLQIKALIGSCLIYFIEGLHVSLTGLIFIPIVKYYKLTQLRGCLISSSLMLFMAIGSLFSGFLTNKFTRKKIWKCF